MTAEQDPEGILSTFSEIISILEKNLKYIDSLGMGEETVRDYRKVILYLKSRPLDEIGHILGKHPVKKKAAKKTEPEKNEEELANMTIEQVRRVLISPNTSRSCLERLASARFGVTRGALSSLRSRDALVTKIFTLLAHEGTHEAISRAAEGQADDRKD